MFVKQCECDKSCDVGEYLDYENYKCREKLVDKLIEHNSAEECTESIDEVKIAEIFLTGHENVYVSSYTICVILCLLVGT